MTGWSGPVNLSQSGAATKPQIVVDANDLKHVIWQDRFAGFIYASGDGENWSPPAAVEFPFGRTVILANGSSSRPIYEPLLNADSNGRIHAYWMDDEGALFYSRALSTEFGELDSWIARQQLAEFSVNIDATVDTLGRLHLAYVRPVATDQFPAGVYYRRSNDGGNTWSEATLLFQSPYFRTLTGATAQVSLAAGGNEVLVAWDDRPQERVFAARSVDAGNTWEQAVEIDRREEDDGEGSVGPSQAKALFDGTNFHLIWQAGHDALTCSQYHQYSLDGGQTWQPRRRMLVEFEVCPESNEYLATPDGITVLAETVSGVYAASWNGDRWSEPVRQGVLSAFSNPVTFRAVEFGCRKAVLDSGLQIYVVGCDEALSGDIWLWSGSLASINQLAERANVLWRPPEVVALRPEGQTLGSVSVVADGDGQLHAFWSQGDATGSAIFYSRWDGVDWTPAADVLTSPGGQFAVQPAVISDGRARLMAVWSDSERGDIYFSQSTTALAEIPSEWFPPTTLPALQSAAAPSVAINQAGVIYVAYTVRLNEDRGIYITSSDDNGDTWSDPFLAFDGGEAGWELVDRPQIVVTGDGTLHVIFMHRSLPPEARPLGWAYAASTDRGMSWSEAADLPFDSVPAAWAAITASGDETLFRFWQEESQDGSDIWSQRSIDSGLNWERPVLVSDIGNPGGQVAVAADGAGQPQLLQLALEDAEPRLQHWAWTESGWVSEDVVLLEQGEVFGVTGIAAAVTASGNLAVVHPGPELNIETGQLQPAYLSSLRSLALSSTVSDVSTQVTVSAETTPEDARASLDTPTPEAEALTPTPLPTPTRIFPTGAEAGGSLPGSSLLGPLAIVIPVGMVVLVIFVIGLRVVRASRP